MAGYRQKTGEGEALSRSDSLLNPGLRQKQLRQTTNIEACKRGAFSILRLICQ